MSEFFEYKFFSEKSNFDKCLSSKSIEYNENDAKDRNRALNEIKQLIGESIDFAMKDKSCADDDEFLLRFLFARKFNVAAAFKLLLNYHDFKQRNASILSKISVLDEGIKLALRDGFPTIIPQRDRKGRKIIVMFASNWNPADYSLITIFRALLLSLEKLLEDVHNQATGFVIIVDWTNFSYKQTGNLQLKTLKLMIEGLQVSAKQAKCDHFKCIYRFVSLFFAGLFPSYFQRSAFYGSAMVRRGNFGFHPSIFRRRNSRKFDYAWSQLIDIARFHYSRCVAN